MALRKVHLFRYVGGQGLDLQRPLLCGLTALVRGQVYETEFRADITRLCGKYNRGQFEWVGDAYYDENGARVEEDGRPFGSAPKAAVAPDKEKDKEKPVAPKATGTDRPTGDDK